MQRRLSLAAGREQSVLFVPHLLPVARGLLSTCYLDLGASGGEAGERLRSAYAREAFVEVLEEGQWPEPRNVRGTNRVEIGWVRDPETGRVIVISAIDNLGKGAAGQAVQNMNVMLGLAETTGLELSPALP